MRYLVCFLFILLLNNACFPPQSSPINPCLCMYVCMDVWFPFHELCKTILPAVSNQRRRKLKTLRLEGEAVQFSALSLSTFVCCALPRFCSDSYNTHYSSAFLKFYNCLNVTEVKYFEVKKKAIFHHAQVSFFDHSMELRSIYIYYY